MNTTIRLSLDWVTYDITVDDIIVDKNKFITSFDKFLCNYVMSQNEELDKCLDYNYSEYETL